MLLDLLVQLRLLFAKCRLWTLLRRKPEMHLLRHVWIRLRMRSAKERLEICS